jgi:peptidoglycan hydrolase-like protein with peptidoglycan-binding domain
MAHYMCAPLGHTAIAALTTFSLIAGANALYLQDGMHPAPLFGGVAVRPAVSAPREARPAPVIPATRSDRPAPMRSSAETTGSVPPPAAENAIGNAEVADVQRKLQALGLFEDRVDGYYGPRTARAIRTFEERLGLKPRGELNKEVIARILSTSSLSAPARRPSAPEAAPVRQPVAPPAPIAPPLAATVSPMTVGTIEASEQRTLRRELPTSPAKAVEVAADAAGEAIGTIINGVQTVMMNRPAQPLPAKPEPMPPMVTAEVPAAPAALAVMPEASAMPAVPAGNDRDTVARVQRGLASLGFLHGPADGVAGEATAKAIRNFEVYYNYEVTGRITPDLLRLLAENGAVI